jgi:hypothetical protein
MKKQYHEPEVDDRAMQSRRRKRINRQSLGRRRGERTQLDPIAKESNLQKISLDATSSGSESRTPFSNAAYPDSHPPLLSSKEIERYMHQRRRLDRIGNVSPASSMFLSRRLTNRIYAHPMGYSPYKAVALQLPRNIRVVKTYPSNYKRKLSSKIL